MKFETRSIHAGEREDPGTGSVISPVYPSTIFRHEDDESRSAEFVYTRAANPNRSNLETLVASLENGKNAAAFSSGMAATAAVFQSLEPGDHVIVSDDLYHGTRVLLNDIMKRWKLDTSYVDTTDPDNIIKAANTKTRLVWIETPTNPMLHITDIKKVCELAREQYWMVCVDNTWASPVLQNPLNLGADLVMHSATKYLSGHSDILAGVVITKEESEFFARIRSIQVGGGAVPSSFDCWLLQRSIKTLQYRMRGHCENAGRIAEFLKGHPVIEDVFYPGLPSHPGHDIAKKQMNGFGGMVSFMVKGSGDDAMRITSSADLIANATSLGGVESLWEQRVRSEPEGTQVSPRLIRLSVGLEHPDDLIADIDKALSRHS